MVEDRSLILDRGHLLTVASHLKIAISRGLDFFLQYSTSLTISEVFYLIFENLVYFYSALYTDDTRQYRGGMHCGEN